MTISANLARINERIRAAAEKCRPRSRVRPPGCGVKDPPGG